MALKGWVHTSGVKARLDAERNASLLAERCKVLQIRERDLAIPVMIQHHLQVAHLPWRHIWNDDPKESIELLRVEPPLPLLVHLRSRQLDSRC